MVSLLTNPLLVKAVLPSVVPRPYCVLVLLAVTVKGALLITPLLPLKLSPPLRK